MGYRPRMAEPKDVQISREGHTAVIQFNDCETGSVYLKIGHAIEFMDDSDILALHNDIVRAQLESAANWRPTEIAEGRPQIKFDRKFGQWSAEGHILRCMIDCDSSLDEPIIQIDENRLSLKQFGALLSHFQGWGMRIAFVSEDQLCTPPIPEVRKAPKRISKRELEEIARAEARNGLE